MRKSLKISIFLAAAFFALILFFPSPAGATFTPDPTWVVAANNFDIYESSSCCSSGDWDAGTLICSATMGDDNDGWGTVSCTTGGVDANKTYRVQVTLKNASTKIAANMQGTGDFVDHVAVKGATNWAGASPTLGSCGFYDIGADDGTVTCSAAWNATNNVRITNTNSGNVVLGISGSEGFMYAITTDASAVNSSSANYFSTTIDAQSEISDYISITKVTAPTVTNNTGESGVSAYSAQLNGNITSTGVLTVTGRGFAWGTNANLSGGDTATTTSWGSFSTGTFYSDVSSLTCNNPYYYRAWAQNSKGTSTASSIEPFTTSACATLTASNHTFGQQTNRWNMGDTSTSTIHYRYKLTPTAESMRISTTTISLSDISQITANDISSAKLWIDGNSDGATTTAPNWGTGLIGGDGTGWADATYERVQSLTSHNNKLYAGLGQTAGDAEVWEYNGSSWTKIGGDGTGWADSTYEVVQSLASHNNKLYAGLGENAGEAEVWEYDGSSWTKIGGDGIGWADSTYEYIFSLASHNNKLYAGLALTAGDAEVWEYNGDFELFGFGNIVVSGDSGRIDFATSTSYIISTTTEFLVELTVNPIEAGDSMTMDFYNASSTGVISGSGITITGNPSSITHLKEAAIAPTVTNSTGESSVTADSARLNGEVTALGGANTTGRGFAWGTASNLSGGDTATTTEWGDWGSTGIFYYDASSLNCGTNYYYRAWAQNSAGTSTASLIEPFTTSACPAVPWTTLTQRAGVFQSEGETATSSSLTNVNIGERLRVKFQIDTDSGATTTRTFFLQYDKNDANWATTSPSAEIRPAQSEVIKDRMILGGPEVAPCQSGKVWPKATSATTTAGVYYNVAYENTNRTDAIYVAGNTCQEIAFTIDTQNALAGTTYRFRLATSTNTGITYSSYPQIATVSTLSLSFSKGMATSTPTGTSSMPYLFDPLGYSNTNSSNNVYEAIGNEILDAVEDIEASYPGSETGALFGRSVSSGDFNGDGYRDMLIGSASSTLEKVYIYFGSENGIRSTSTPDVILEYPEADTYAYFGDSVSSGDFNGDGYDDALVGAYQSDNPGADEGAAYIFFGSSQMATPDATADIELNYPEADTTAYFGYSVSSGDFNGDGYDDALVGAYRSNNPGADEGAAYIFFGSSQMSSPDDTADIELNYPEADAGYFGKSVFSGDFNGDGYDDALVGADSSDNPGAGEGAAYIFFGSSQMSSPDDTADIELNYPEADTYTYFGKSVSSGDFNGDGYDDALVGADSSDNPGADEGAVYAFYGGQNRAASVSAADKNYECPSASGSVCSGAQFGQSTATGDFNGDGFLDMLVGNASSTLGKVFVFLGSDGIHPATTTPVILQSPDSGANYFGYRVSSGDFNGDGYDDALVGAYGYPNGSYYGRAYIFYGNASWSGTDSTADVTLGNPNGSNADNFGVSVSSGDFNGDGYDDALVGANSYGTPDAGRAYIFYGNASWSGTDSIADVT
ncbi:MAG: hypothetical protein A2Y98_00340 [Candidatus Portnoybacteria bacterium RBG_19FT_COMBO_36_7]|uniref:Fibronectin type-III domain-containing protein n=1 Tax=Candidatus Portnoybacteria bacterium RBG_19FT_COMBO_36_7 TaxID=1801992 RepID=A0A1G2FAD6_9BACT|nr:MAG: hypothetical protein A2Y98_00340 [Candidatus Portnoybacteria bacterium RBG_19FT_COMBO_36_7]